MAIDTAAIRTLLNEGETLDYSEVEDLLAAVDRLAAALVVVAGMREYAPGQWVADAECSNMDLTAELDKEEAA